MSAAAPDGAPERAPDLNHAVSELIAELAGPVSQDGELEPVPPVLLLGLAPGRAVRTANGVYRLGGGELPDKKRGPLEP